VKRTLVRTISITQIRLSPLRIQIIGLAVARLVLNTGHRMVYPFLPTFARGLGVDLEAIALVVTARSGLGLISPVFGAFADARGRKNAMLAALLLFAASMALVSLWPTYPALFVALLLASSAKLLYDPSMQAYIGDRVQYTRRGLAIAITELSWSGAFLLGIPLLGWLIARADTWRAPFVPLALAGLGASILVWRLLPADEPLAVRRPSLAQGARTVLAHPTALAGLGLSMLMNLSNETIGIVYGAWMEDAFGLQVAALGAASAVIGLAELGGEGLVAGVVDRVGKRRAVAAGLALNAGACLLLPALAFRVEGALVGLFVFYITFEFAVVSLIPIMTELLPGARATLMAGNVAFFALGRMLGALIGPPLFAYGLLANGIVAAAGNLLALALLVGFVKQE